MKIPQPAAERERFAILLQPHVDSPILAVGFLSGVPACVRTSAVPLETRRSGPSKALSFGEQPFTHTSHRFDDDRENHQRDWSA